MKFTIALVCIALYMHVGQGAPHGNEKPDKMAAAAPAADKTVPTVPTTPKVETCTADINGTQQTLQTGDRYCVDTKKHRVCSYGEWIDDSCPDESICLKSPTSWQVLCRIYIKNAKQEGPTGEGQSEPQPTETKPVESQSQPAPAPVPAPAPAPSEPETNPAPAPAPAPAPKSTESNEENKPAPAPGSAPAPVPSADNKPQAPTDGQTTPADVTSCSGGMNVGDRRCTGEKGTAFRLCDHGGKIVDDKCPDGSVCLNSPTVPQIVCRQYNTNPPQQTPPHERR